MSDDKVFAPKVILLSGPPRSGKDTAGKLIQQVLGGTLEKFSAPMKAAIPAMLSIPFSMLEETKDADMPLLGLPSFRQLQIDMSEQWMKQSYGDDVFARLLLYRMRVQDDNVYIVTDCGFQVEVNTLAAELGPENCILIRLHRTGCTYLGDSRSTVHPFRNMNVININNDSDVDTFEKHLLYAVDLLWKLQPIDSERANNVAKEHTRSMDLEDVYAPQRGDLGSVPL